MQTKPRERFGELAMRIIPQFIRAYDRSFCKRPGWEAGPGMKGDQCAPRSISSSTRWPSGTQLFNTMAVRDTIIPLPIPPTRPGLPDGRRRNIHTPRRPPQLRGSIVLTTCPEPPLSFPADATPIPLTALLSIADARMWLNTELLQLPIEQTSDRQTVDLEHNPKYTWVRRTCDGREFSFTDLQAIAINNLYSRSPQKLNTEDVMANSQSSSSVANVFRNSDAWGVLVCFDGKGLYWLNLQCQ